MNDQKQFCTFYLDDLLFGIDVLSVQEIILYQEMTQVPMAPPVIKGLINLRGQVVTAMDLRMRLGLEPRDTGQPPTNVIIRAEDEIVSFMVDRIGDVVEPDEATFESPPKTIAPNVREFILGIYKLNNRLLLIMDVERAMDIKPEPV